jgi:hypothetical protein
LPADYVDPNNPYHFLNELKPHLCFVKRQDETATNYLLESIEPTLPRYQLRKRVKDFVEYLANCDDVDSSTTPVALLICPTTADLLYVKRRAKKLLEEDWLDEGIHIRITTIDKIRASGVASMIWEEA